MQFLLLSDRMWLIPFLSAVLSAILSQLMVSVPVPFHTQGKPPLLSQKVLVLGRKLGTRNKNKGVKVSYSCFWNEPTSVLSVWVGFLSVTEKIWGRGQGWMLSTCDCFASNTCFKVAQKKLGLGLG